MKGSGKASVTPAGTGKAAAGALPSIESLSAENGAALLDEGGGLLLNEILHVAASGNGSVSPAASGALAVTQASRGTASVS